METRVQTPHKYSICVNLVMIYCPGGMVVGAPVALGDTSFPPALFNSPSLPPA